MKPSVLLFLLLFVLGCTAAKYTLAPSGTLPSHMPDMDIAASQSFNELQRTYGSGIAYERAKIKYLLEMTGKSPYSFVRMDYVYGGKQTADHLRRKYKQRYSQILTARDYIANVASISTGWGRPYLALPGDGLAYPTGDLLTYELNRLEAFMEGTMKNKKNEVGP